MSESLKQLGRPDVVKALSDQNFLAEFPQFKMLHGKMDMRRKSNGATGCSSCRQKQIMSGVTTDFLNILATFSQGEVDRMKKYFDADKILYTAFDPSKGAYRTRVV